MFQVILSFFFFGIANALLIVRSDQRSISSNGLLEEERYENMEDKIPYKRLQQPTNRQLPEIQNRADLLSNGEHQVKKDRLLDELRCGVPDVAHYAVTGRDLKWKSMIITYRIVNHTPGLPPDDLEHEIREALKTWSKVTPLQFIQTHSTDADLMISFNTKDHGDVFPFDGPGGVLAHAFPPGEHLGGDVHFDDEETWTVDSEDCSLFSVAVHEFGHTLGLAHSRNPHALMYPIYTYFNSKNLSLPADDVLGIQALYGSKPSSVITPTICSQEVPIDAMAYWEGGIIIFKDRHVWYHHPTLSTHKALPTTSLWEEVPDFIDAAYNYPSKDTILLFNGRQFWSVSGSNMKVEEPGDIGDFGFPKTVMRIDAAVHDGDKGKTIFITGDLCWSYNEEQRRMDSGNPVLLELQFPGVGNQVDAAYMHENGNIYFYHGETQIEYDPRIRHVTGVIENVSAPC